MKLLSLNCQKGYHPGLTKFLEELETRGVYDFILLQEVTDTILQQLKRGKSHRVLDAYNSAVEQQSQLCVLYLPRHTLVQSDLISIEGKHPTIVRRSEFGLLVGTFSFEGKDTRIGSLHLHPSFRSNVRYAGLREFKGRLMEDPVTPCVIGGDCNFGPGELRRAVALMSSEFVCVTKEIGPTLDSRYSEPAPNLINSSAVVLAQFGLGVSLRADHFFVDDKTTKSSQVRCRVLPDRVSDHSPIEMEMW